MVNGMVWTDSLAGGGVDRWSTGLLCASCDALWAS